MEREEFIKSLGISLAVVCAASFVATEVVCPHQGGTLKWLEANNFIQYQLHQSEYKPDGSIIQGPQGVAGSTRALKLYAVSIAGTKVTATTATA